MQGRALVRGLVAILCLTATGLGLANTYGDDTEVKAAAQKAACGSPSCSYSMLRESRSAISQSFTFQTALVEKGKRDSNASVDVECQREYYLFGAHHCRVTSGGLPVKP